MRFSAPAPVQTTALFLALLVARASAETYYVSPRGKDTNLGTDLAAPWRTLKKAANTLVAGDTVLIRKGTYRELVTPVHSGSAAGGWITYQAYANEKPVIDATGIRHPNDGESAVFLIKNLDYIRVQGLELCHFSTQQKDPVPCGLFVLGGCDHIELRGNLIHHIATTAKKGNALGLAVYGTDANKPISALVIDGNEIRHCHLGSSESLVLNGNVAGFSVTNNHVHHNNIGIDFVGFEATNPDVAAFQVHDGVCRGNVVDNITSYGNPAYGRNFGADGIYVDGGAGITIERNVVHHCDIGIELASENPGVVTSGVTLRDNLVYANRIGGLFLGGYDTERGGTEKCDVQHNTFYHNDTRSAGNGELYFQHWVKECTFRNNLFIAGSQKLLLGSPYNDSTGNTLDTNLYFAPGDPNDAEWQWAGAPSVNFATYKTTSGQDAASTFADPKLVNPAELDFHLAAGSPAIDAGDAGFTPAAGETDLDGDPRVKGTRVDLGADEF